MITIDQFKVMFEEDIVMVGEGEIVENTQLETLEDWDSMAVVALNGALDEHYGFTLNEEEIKSLVTFSDILKFIMQKNK
jgi:acyl carrier protein